MAKKTSANAKANYSRYQAEDRAATNKAAKIARHVKKHPNDEQSAKRVKGQRAGMSHAKNTPLEARLRRMMKTGWGGSIASNDRANAAMKVNSRPAVVKKAA